MGIDVADAGAEQLMPGNKGEDLVVVSDKSLWELLNEGEEVLPVSDTTHCKFADDEGMY